MSTEEVFPLYSQATPRVGENVVAQITEITPVGCFAQLLEYGNKRGMLLWSEMSRRRIKTISKVTRVGKMEVVQVLRISNEEMSLIDLSKKFVRDDEYEDAMRRFNDIKIVRAIIRQVSGKMNQNLGDLYAKIVYPLDEQETFDHPIEAMRYIAAKPESLAEFLPEIAADEELAKLLLESINQRLSPQPAKARAEFEICCFSEEGIKGIKEALKSGLKVNNELQLQLLHSPDYMMVFVDPSPERAMEVVQKALKHIERKLVKISGGNCSFKLKEGYPKIVSGDEEEEHE